ncbi:MAG: hypothetical protein ACRDOK_22210, partial [Streptosporangiaceae bacterium]
GHAQGVERLRLPGSGSSLRAGPGNGAPVIGRITVTIPDRVVGCQPCATGPAARGASRGDPAGPHTDGSDALAAALLRAAARAADRARAARAANQAAAGCAHHSATAVYRPSPRLRELVVARDLTCTFPPCGQPAWNADLDHTVAWQRGGPTCNCNLGGRCRTHHKIKQLPGWKLEQSQAGIFRWTTPAGHSYLVQPYRYPV